MAVSNISEPITSELVIIAPPAPPLPPPHHKKDESLPPEAIIGIVLGGVVLLVALGALCLWCQNSEHKGHKRVSTTEDNAFDPKNGLGSGQAFYGTTPYPLHTPQRFHALARKRTLESNCESVGSVIHGIFRRTRSPSDNTGPTRCHCEG